MKVTRLGGVYPYVGRSTNGTVVFFTSNDTATVLSSPSQEGLAGEVYNLDERLFTRLEVPGLGSGFRPVEIVLESDEEVAYMGDRLNELPRGNLFPKVGESMYRSFVEGIDS